MFFEERIWCLATNVKNFKINKLQNQVIKRLKDLMVIKYGKKKNKETKGKKNYDDD